MSESHKSDRQKTEKQQKPALNFLLISAGSMFTSMIVAGFIVGYAFDQLFDTTPIFLLSCGVLGFIGGIMKVHKLLEKMDLMDQPKKEETEAASKEQNKDPHANS